jgi:putative aldouronate transport system substrate-binding protein
MARVKRGLLVLLLAAVAMPLAIYAGGTKEKAEPKPTAESTVAAQPAGENPNAFAKLASPAEISFVVMGSDGMQYDDQNTPSDNWWTRWAEELLNIKPKLMWSSTSAQSQQKWQLTVASGTLPDILPLNSQDFHEFQKAGKLEDITDAFDKYASNTFKSYMKMNEAGVKQATFGGRLLGIPGNNDNAESGYMIWLRYDWLQKVGLQPPKTMDDLVNIARAFATQDPDGNGKSDTIGFEINRELLYGFGWALGGIDGFFNGFHSYPTSWVRDASGKLAWGGIQPETKAALQRLQQMYRDGTIDREFGVKDSQKILEDVTAGTIGLLIGPWWHPEYPTTFNQQKDPKADWKCYPLVSVDSKPARPGVSSDRIGHFFSLRKGYQPTDAFIKLFNLYIRKYYETPADYPKIEWLQFAAPVWEDPNNKDLIAFHNVTAAIKSGDTSRLNGLELTNYDRIQKYLKGEDNTLWWAWKEYYDDPKDPTAFNIVQNLYIDGGLNLKDAYIGPDYTKAFVQRWSTLEKLEKEMITKVITGASVSEFDTFVANWKKLGGDEVTAEANAWDAEYKNQ